MADELYMRGQEILASFVSDRKLPEFIKIKLRRPQEEVKTTLQPQTSSNNIFTAQQNQASPITQSTASIFKPAEPAKVAQPTTFPSAFSGFSSGPVDPSAFMDDEGFASDSSEDKTSEPDNTSTQPQNPLFGQQPPIGSANTTLGTVPSTLFPGLPSTSTTATSGVVNPFFSNPQTTSSLFGNPSKAPSSGITSAPPTMGFPAVQKTAAFPATQPAAVFPTFGNSGPVDANAFLEDEGFADDSD